MMTETSGGTSGLTRRSVKWVQHQSYEENTIIQYEIDWFIFTGTFVLQKEVFVLDKNNFVSVVFSPSREHIAKARNVLALSGLMPGAGDMSHGLAYTVHPFAEGAERMVYQCSEVGKWVVRDLCLLMG